MNNFLYIESREEENTSLDSKRVLLNEEITNILFHH